MLKFGKCLQQALFCIVFAACANLATQRAGATEKEILFSSANPKNYEAILARAPMTDVELKGRPYLPSGSAPHPAVIITPGSGGVSPPMVRHAQALADAGIAAFLIDPFTSRGVTSTVADQTQLSFATSTYDVLAAAKQLATLVEIDAKRIGALGYSRGGTAVLQAAISPLAQSVLGEGRRLTAIAAGWPWCGLQFEKPATAPTAVRFLVAASDNWVSPIQCQAYAGAMASTNPNVSIRLFKGAFHGFGYGIPIREIPNAVKSINAPIVYFNQAGVAIDWYSGEAMPGIGELYLGKYGAEFVDKGVRIGSTEGQADQFIADVIAFFKRSL
jgi:dienelactone hydrolase